MMVRMLCGRVFEHVCVTVRVHVSVSECGVHAPRVGEKWRLPSSTRQSCGFPNQRFPASCWGVELKIARVGVSAAAVLCSRGW